MRPTPVAVGFSDHVDLPGLMQAGRWSSPVMLTCCTERLQATRGAVARVRRGKDEENSGRLK